MPTIHQLIDLAVQQTPYGQITMTVGVHNGEVRYLMGNEQITKTFNGANCTQQAVEFGLALLAQDRQAGKSGTLTVTYEMQAGNVKKIHAMRQMKHKLGEQI